MPRDVNAAEAARRAAHSRIRPTPHLKHPVRLVCVWISILAWVSVTGCSSTDVAVSAPTAKCQVTVDNSQPTAPAGGGTGTLTVTTTPECAWDVTTATSWIAITTASHGQGSGTVTYRVAANADASGRGGTLSVNGTQISITQEASCRYTVTPLTPSIGAGGGTLEIQVETAGACRWDASTQASWIHVAGSPIASGGGRLILTIDANGGAVRSGAVVIADQTVTVRQAAAVDPSCVFQVTPLTISLPAEGGTAPIAVMTTASCQWGATATVTWITITGGPAGAGAGTVSLSVAANPGPARTGIVTVAGQTVTVTQAAASGPPCTFVVAPTTTSVPAEGGTLTVRVTTTPTCVWQAGVSASWIVVASAPTTTGSGTVQLSVALNHGPGRSATVTVAGQEVTVVQAAAVAPCSFGVTPLQIAVPAAGGNGTVTVTAPNGCAWTASKNAFWLTIVSGVSSAGNGTVTFAVSANSESSPRSDVLTVAGQAVTITQPGAAVCESSISPSSASVDKNGTTITVNVMTGLGCAWTAQAHADWLSIVAGASGAGSGVARVEVEKLTGAPRDRVGTVTIAGQTLTVTQVK
jgi:hypothetical protein